LHLFLYIFSHYILKLSDVPAITRFIEILSKRGSVCRECVFVGQWIKPIWSSVSEEIGEITHYVNIVMLVQLSLNCNYKT